MSSLTNPLFLGLHIWKMVPFGVNRWQMDTRAQAGVGAGGDFHVWLAPICAALYGIGLWDLQS